MFIESLDRVGKAGGLLINPVAGADLAGPANHDVKAAGDEVSAAAKAFIEGGKPETLLRSALGAYESAWRAALAMSPAPGSVDGSGGG